MNLIIKPQKHAPAILRLTFFVPLLLLTLTLAAKWGVQEKSLWVKFWDIWASGLTGGIIGAGLSVLVGGIGVAILGTGFGIGILGLAAIGGAMGLGTGGIIHILRNPHGYTYDWKVILPVTILGILISTDISRRLRDFFLPPGGEGGSRGLSGRPSEQERELAANDSGSGR